LLDPVTLIHIGVAAGVGGVIVYRTWFSKSARRARLLKRARPTLVRDAKEGAVVKIVGRLRHGDRVHQAPYSKRPCAYYGLVITQNPNSEQSQVVKSEARWLPFYVEDTSGRAFVPIDGRAPLMIVVDDRHVHARTFGEDDPGARELVASRGIEVRGLIFDKSFEVREGVLEEGELVAVLGRACWEVDAAGLGGGFREPPKRLVLRDPAEHELVVSDEPALVGTPGGPGSEDIK
jgi:hypothetical protein